MFHFRAIFAVSVVAALPGLLSAQVEPGAQRDSAGALGAFRDARAAAVRASAETSLARLRAIPGSSWRVLVSDDLGTPNWIILAINESSPASSSSQ